MPPAQLASLPHELKVKIADECHAADQRIDELFEDLERRGGFAFESRESASVKHRRKTYPSAISALYSTSKEWQGLVVSHRFQRLTSSQMVKPLFQLMLARRNGHFVRHVSLPIGVTAEHLASFVGVLGWCPNLQSLELKEFESSLQRLSTNAGEDVVSEVLVSLAPACKQLDTLTLAKIRSSEAIELLASTTRLRRLSLAVYSPADLHDLWKMLRNAPGLTALDLVLPLPTTAHPSCLATLRRTAPRIIPPLVELKIDFQQRPAGLAEFLSAFEPTLQRLHVKATSFAGMAIAGASDIFTSHGSLPQLLRFELAGDAGGIGRILLQLEPERLPGLRHLGIFPFYEPRTDDLLNAVKSAVFRHVEVTKVDFFPLHSGFNVRRSPDFFQGLGVEYVSTRAHDCELAYMNKSDARLAFSMLPEGTDARAHLVAAVDKTLDHVQRARHRAALLDDDASLARLAELLGPFDLDRALHEA